MQAKTLHATSVDSLKEQLSSFKDHNFLPNLAILFSSPRHSISELQQIFATDNIRLAGCTSAGEIANNEMLEGSIVVLLLKLKEELFSIRLAASQTRTTYQTAFAAGQHATEQFACPALIVLSGGVKVNADEIIMGFRDTLPASVPIFGGLASDDLSLQKTLVFTENEICEDGLLTLILDHEKIEVKGLATSGWQPLGGTNLITKAEGNTVYTINNQPALDVFLRYFGFFDNVNIEGKPITTISAQYPLQILRENGNHVLRSPLVGNEEDRSLMLAGGVKTGDQFRFSISPGLEVVDETVTAFQTLKTEISEADALILFSCKGRHAALGPMIEDEIEGIYNYWQRPMIGFFSYGEIGSDHSGKCDFHNETCSLIVLHEKKVVE